MRLVFSAYMMATRCVWFVLEEAMYLNKLEKDVIIVV